MRTFLRVAVVGALVLALHGCNARNPVLDAPAVQPTGKGPAIPTPSSTIFSIAVNPPALIGPGAARGTVTLSLPAPADGLDVILGSDTPSVSVPERVTVPGGAEAADFPLAAQAVTSDVSATIAASVGNRTLRATVQNWTVLPTFFSFVSDPDDWVGGGGIRRFVSPSGTFSANCQGSTIDIRIDRPGSYWGLMFSARRNNPLTVGTYAAGPVADVNAPRMSIGGEGRGCSSSTGTFVVHEAQFTRSGDVRRFWATFEQHCDNRTPALRGDVRLTDVGNWAPYPYATCLQP